MANVLTVLKIVPSDTELDREDFVNNTLKGLCEENNIEFGKYDEEPVAYGIIAILAYLKNSDSEEGADDLNNLQEALEGMEELSTVEVQLQQLTDH
jgi:translation elongation factor aEF-1 beta